MALFSRKNAETTAPETVVAPAPASTAQATDFNQAGIIIRPHLTEKSVMQGDNHVYTFIVHKDATKYAVAKAVTAIYKVTPVKVNIVNKLPRKKMSRTKGRTVSEKGYKKAYVYLKSGDSISLV